MYFSKSSLCLCHELETKETKKNMEGKHETEAKMAAITMSENKPVNSN